MTPGASNNNEVDGSIPTGLNRSHPDGDQPYQLIHGDGNGNGDGATVPNGSSSPLPSYAVTAQRTTVRNFVLMSVLFSANHGCVVACLALATAQLGATGAWQSGVLYLTYTASALLGATYLVKQVGPRNALMVGMGLYGIYVACFWLATKWASYTVSLALFGAGIGGIGAGCLWTAQGAYFSSAAEEHAYYKQREHYQQQSNFNGDGEDDDNMSVNQSILSESTSYLAGLFAFLYLAEEVVLRLLSTALLQFNIASWGTVFAIYTAISVISAAGMIIVRDYSTSSSSSPPSSSPSSSSTANSNDASAILYKITAAAQLVWTDPKMKYMIGLNAMFGLTSAFLNSYVNGQVVPVALRTSATAGDDGGRYIGVLTSWVSMVAAVMSLVLGKAANKYGKAPVLIFGSICFIGVVSPFILYPPETFVDQSGDMGSSSSSSSSPWGWVLLMLIYTLHGTGRATFESTLKATFADYFPQEKEGAFANIIWQNGLSGAIGYVLTFALTCTPSDSNVNDGLTSTHWGCVRYNDGTFHDVGSFELLCLCTGIFAVVGLVRASALYKKEIQERHNHVHVHPETAASGENQTSGVSA